MIASIKDMAIMNNKGYITLEIDHNDLIRLEELKDNKLNVDIKKYRQNRNLDQNAYFHVLVNKLARKFNLSDAEMKQKLNLDYGTLARDENGSVLGCKVPKDMDLTKIYKYAKWYKTDADGLDCWMFYKETHLLNTEEFAKLLSGTVQECIDNGIETETPEMIEERYGIKINAQTNKSNTNT